MSAIALATRGYIANAIALGVVNTHPQVRIEDLRPEILARETDAPTEVVEAVSDLKPTIRTPRRPR